MSAGEATSQDFPTKPVRIIVANPAGSTPDILARHMIPELSRLLGQPVYVEAKPGADQRIAAQYVAKFVQPDGYTLALLGVSPLASIPALVKNPGFDPLKDLVPITTLVSGRIFFATVATSPWRSFNEFVAYAQRHPGQLNYGAHNLSTRMRIEAVLREKKLDVVHIPYGSTTAIENALVANQVQLIIASNGIAANKAVRVLAVSGNARFARFPDVPTFVELGLAALPGAEYSLSVTHGTPRPIFDLLQSAVAKTLQNPDLKSRVDQMDFEIVGDSPDAAAKNLAAQTDQVMEVAKRIGIRPE